MKLLISFSLIFFAACASNQKYSQERIEGQKHMWMVRALEVPCADNYKQCKENVKKEIGARSKHICGKQPFTVLNCEYNESSSTTIVAACKVRCGQKPAERAKDARPDNDSGDGLSDAGSKADTSAVDDAPKKKKKKRPSDDQDGEESEEKDKSSFDWTDQ